MIYLIDAFNLSYKFPDIELLMYKGNHPAARESLLKLFHSFRMKSKKAPEVHLFFDGKKEPGNDTKKEVRSDMNLYYSHDMSADHLIKEFIKRFAYPGELLVVSSDKEVKQFAKKHKCHVKASEEFEQELTRLLQDPVEEEIQPGTEENPEVSREEILYWRKIFAEEKKLKKKGKK